MKTMIKTILISFLLLYFGYLISNVIINMFPNVYPPIPATFELIFFVTYIWVNFDRFSAKQIAIDKFEKENPDKKIKLTEEDKKKLRIRYLRTFGIWFIILFIANIFHLINLS